MNEIKKELSKYKLLWKVTEQFDFSGIKERDKIQAALLNNLNREQGSQLYNEYDQVYSFLENKLKSLDIGNKKIKELSKNCRERKEEVISNIIGNGYDSVLSVLMEDLEAWEKVEKTNICFCYEIPYDHDYKEKENNTFTVENVLKKAENKFDIVKREGGHLNPSYIKEVEKNYKYFRDSLIEASNGNFENYDKTDYYNRIKEFQKLSKWATHVIAIHEKRSFDYASNDIVSYDFPNKIEELIAGFLAKDMKIEV